MELPEGPKGIYITITFYWEFFCFLLNTINQKRVQLSEYKENDKHDFKDLTTHGEMETNKHSDYKQLCDCGLKGKQSDS